MESTVANEIFVGSSENKSWLEENEWGNVSIANTSLPEKKIELLSPFGYHFSAAILLIIWILGSTGNLVVIYLVASNKKTPMNMFLVNLSVADFIMAAIGSPFTFTAAVVRGWPFGDFLCSGYGFGMALGGIVSITTLMVLAFERFLMIARPFHAKDVKLHHSFLLIIATWMYSLILTLPPLFGWASYGPEGPYISCSVSWERNDLQTKGYIIFLFVMGLVLPLTTIILSYFGIVYTLRKSATDTATRAEMRVLAMVVTMVVAFLLAWLPYAIVALIVAFSDSSTWITPGVTILPALFAKSSTCYNPIIYVGLNTQFRSAWLNLFGKVEKVDEEQTTVSLTAQRNNETNPTQGSSKPMYNTSVNTNSNECRLVEEKPLLSVCKSPETNKELEYSEKAETEIIEKPQTQISKEIESSLQSQEIGAD